MAGKKWRREVSADPRSFRRGPGTKSPRRAILIVTEGSVTEPTYFKALRRKLSLPTVEVAILPMGSGDPQRLVDYALGEAEKRRSTSKAGKLSNAKAAKFDDVWIVFDTDIPVQHGRYSAGLAFAEVNGVQVAPSTPCFEYWLLLHKAYTTAPMPKCEHVIPKLTAALGQKYSKDAEESKKVIPPLLEALDLARANALKVRKHHAEAGTVAPANPSTEVDRLIDLLDPPPHPSKMKKRPTRKKPTS